MIGVVWCLNLVLCSQRLQKWTMLIETFSKNKKLFESVQWKLFYGRSKLTKIRKNRKSLDFRHQNPRSEPKTVPNCKKSKKSTKVFLKVVLQFWWYKLEILYTKIKSNLLFPFSFRFFIFRFFLIFWDAFWILHDSATPN